MSYFPDIDVEIFVIAIVVMLVLVVFNGFVLWFAKRRAGDDYVTALEETLSAGGTGTLFFDANHKLQSMNDLARHYLHSFADGNDDIQPSFGEFLAYLFDHGVNDDYAFLIPHSQNEKDGADEYDSFREVILTDDGDLVLIKIYKAKAGRVLALVQDVTQLKEKDDDISTLFQANEKLQMAIEASSCGVVLFHKQGEAYSVDFTNQSLCKMLNVHDDFSDDAGLKQVLEELLQNPDQDALFQAIDGSGKFQRQVKFRDVGGGVPRWCDIRLTPVYDRDEMSDMYVGVFSDITELKMRENELFQVHKLDALGRLSAGIAHDFNNILSIVQGYARMIETNRGDGEKVEQFCERILGAVKRGAGLTKQMMVFGRDNVVQEEVSDLKKVLFEHEVLFKPLLGDGITVEISNDDVPLYGHCAADNFEQILMNLVINARDSMQGDGQLGISLKEVSDAFLVQQFGRDHGLLQGGVCLQVSDTGTGIPEDIMDRIFDPFFSTKSKDEGFGLGLSVVYGIVKNIGGYIDVASEVSVGTTVSVYIPRSAELSEDLLHADEKTYQEDGFQGATILVVEDEPELNDILADFFAKQDMRVLQAYNGNDALVVQEDYDGKIDFLITDIAMPGLNGFKFAEMLSALRPDTHIIFMSGYPENSTNGKIRLPDDSVFMPKPIDFDALTLAMHEMHSQSAA